MKQVFPLFSAAKMSAAPRELEAKLSARISVGEAAGLLAALLFTCGFSWILATRYTAAADYQIYIRTAFGSTADYYYANWMLPVFSLLNALPLVPGYIVWSLLNIAGVFFAARIFGGKPFLMLVSYQFLAILYFGQITGIILGGMALFWWGLNRNRSLLAGIGLLICCTKFQIGVPVGLAMLIFGNIGWSTRIKALVVPAVGFGLSLIIYPGWPIDLLRHIQAVPPDSLASISFWRLAGPLALLFWIPPLVLPIQREQRIAALAAAAVIGLPYFQQADLILLYAFPFGYLPLLGLFGLTFKFFNWPSYFVLVWIPLIFYFTAMLPVRKIRWKVWQTNRQESDL